jgi:hypothetical protein
VVLLTIEMVFLKPLLIFIGFWYLFYYIIYCSKILINTQKCSKMSLKCSKMPQITSNHHFFGSKSPQNPKNRYKNLSKIILNQLRASRRARAVRARCRGRPENAARPHRGFGRESRRAAHVWRKVQGVRICILRC